MNARNALFGRRLLAAIYDLLPMLGLWFLAGVIAVAVTGGRLDPHAIAARIGVPVLVIALWAAYFAYSWTHGGQTLGMRAWHVRVASGDARPLGWSRALWRFACAAVSIAAFGIGWWWALFDPRGRALYDLASHTLVEAG